MTYVLLLLWQEQAANVLATTATVAAPSSSSLVERETDHTIQYDTWSGYNST